MSWILVLFLLPVVLFAVMARRVIRVAQQLRDPEQLRSLLSARVRAAVVEAGLDPDSISLQQIQESEELRRLVASDLQRGLARAIFGLRLPESGMATRAAPAPGPEPVRPAPIDQRSGLPLRAVLILVIVGLVAIAIFVLNSQR